MREKRGKGEKRREEKRDLAFIVANSAFALPLPLLFLSVSLSPYHANCRPREEVEGGREKTRGSGLYPPPLFFGILAHFRRDSFLNSPL